MNEMVCFGRVIKINLHFTHMGEGSPQGMGHV